MKAVVCVCLILTHTLIPDLPLKGTFCCPLVKNVVLHSDFMCKVPGNDTQFFCPPFIDHCYTSKSGPFSGLLHLAALASENGNDCWRYRKIKQQSVPFIVPLSASLKICRLIWFCHWLFLMILFCFFVLFLFVFSSSLSQTLMVPLCVHLLATQGKYGSAECVSPCVTLCSVVCAWFSRKEMLHIFCCSVPTILAFWS